MKTEDRRARKTRKALREALSTLLAEKSVQQISVKELTELADMNRSTFYAHYHDIYDLLSQVEEEMFEKFESILRLEEPHTQLRPFLVNLFHFLQEYGSTCMALMGPSGDMGFISRLEDMVRSACMDSWLRNRGFTADERLELFLDFALSGCIGLIRNWLHGGMRKPPEQAAEEAEQLLLYGAQAVIGEKHLESE